MGKKIKVRFDWREHKNVLKHSVKVFDSGFNKIYLIKDKSPVEGPSLYNQDVGQIVDHANGLHVTLEGISFDLNYAQAHNLLAGLLAHAYDHDYQNVRVKIDA